MLAAIASAYAAETRGYTHEDPRFEIAVSVSEDAEALRARITPRAPWKLSVDFPIRFSVEGGPAARSPVPGRSDGATVDLPLSEVPSGRVAGRISVAVCQGDLCERADHDFELSTP